LIRGASLDFLFKTLFVSSAIESFMGCFAIFFFMLCLSMAEGVEGLAAPLGVPSVGGAWPFRTGVLGGKVLSMYSGEM